jgi:hypothetical protein
MNSRKEVHLNQMAAENLEAIHWLTWPIRFIIDLIKTAIYLAIFIIAVPAIFLGLVVHFIVTGHSLLDADAVLALKVVFTFVAPFAVSIVYRIVQWYQLFRRGEPARRDAVRRSYKFSHHRVFFITLGLMLVGALVAYPAWENMSTELGLGALVLYLTSPMLLLFWKKADYPRRRNEVLCFPDAVEAFRDPHVW